ncbi:acylphosphatase [Staphylococcus cohnii]|uniref:acylphosphatase n=2 Tax=Staphylococcus cohnii TaxID=29382 RepID=A0ABT6J1W6_9STAP|nr:acylphosphatase [Staphylococcus cohnii]TGP60471.1 acylphosphatase [bacterium M00.F.Ca.ET.229.01.1.1]TGS37229.1 acylphosphatase [bacterium M00.F.Ca.ET.180.01.1.1]AYX89807.1 acylphosphatase [Staphylococcus cohnii]KKI62834.1 putative Acylphosphate phosphohydrolase [Staphylococcus cohnii subsp. cohnii]MCI2941949.1 acylphosphatase [Staphylococcus cohnii]
MQCKHIKVFGIVQGVGFRYYTEKIARKYNVVGTVQNISDYVEIYAQSDEASLTSFINAIIEGASPASQVEDYEIEEIETNPSWKKFSTL